ncbi:MAG: GntR family transcriptional regulator [Pelistega sp.]|nr:GntR family transcriptional regulator [Pelistega sp.]
MELLQSRMVEKLPRYEQVRYAIQQRLIAQTWGIDEAIPNEQELADEYQVSVGTIRKAIDLLVADGLLVKQQGKGTFVRYPDFASSLIRFFRHRDTSGQPLIPVGIVHQVQEIPTGDARINEALQRPSTAPLIYIERTRNLQQRIFVSEKIWLPKEAFQALLTIPLAEFDNLLYPMYRRVCSQLIVSAKEQLSFLAQHQDAYLSTQQPETMVKICRYAYGLDGRVLEYRESYGRAAEFYYETVIH